MKIEQITLSNFRGITSPVSIDFKRNNNFTSVAIYGRNGSGKSSFVDAWEWMYSSKILHLSREGAGAQDYPHKLSNGDDCFIEIKTDLLEAPIKVKYDKRRTTHPIIDGEINTFLDNIPHQCHLRFKDLQDFVYYSKTEKYEYLAKFLGLESALNIQNDFKSYLKKLEDDLFQLEEKRDALTTSLSELLGITEITNENVVNYFNQIAEKYELTQEVELKYCQRILNNLETTIQSNPTLKKINSLNNFKRLFIKIDQFIALVPTFETLKSILGSIKKEEDNLKNIVLSELYENGIKTLEMLEDKNICPLCDRRYEGDLLEHIKSKHNTLEKLIKNKTEYERLKIILTSKLNTYDGFSKAIQDDIEYYISVEFENAITSIKEIDLLLQSSLTTLEKSIPNISLEEVNKLEIFSLYDAFLNQKETIKEKINQLIVSLTNDPNHTEQVRLYSESKNIFSDYKTYEVYNLQITKLSSLIQKYQFIIDNFISWINDKIKSRFEEITDDLVSYFNLLEYNSTYLSDPKIHLLEDKNKAVELEVKLAGNPISPAFRILSESQINSFGLSVFLAAIKNFNTEFKFIILDDILNSFDYHKRSKIIEIITSYFNEYQFLILTHDTIWFEKLILHFNNWNRYKFLSWDYTLGPRIENARTTFEEIEADLDADNAVFAAQKLGRFLEQRLQDINHKLLSSVIYNRDNQYTLADLFNGLKGCIKKKLQRNHSLYVILNEFGEQTIFRNFCVHWKNTETDFSSDEIREIYTSWLNIEQYFICGIETCKSMVYYDRTNENIKCNCGHLNLRAQTYYETPAS
ncbi:MAG: hypothetical protein MUP85_10675 [Candidatus Lokiarchaeota archaeon]|nr:hypothetical protein [Candidatus Lokiarchaeota archaeon]